MLSKVHAIQHHDRPAVQANVRAHGPAIRSMVAVINRRDIADFDLKSPAAQSACR